jgi:hypothetical protein
MLKPFGERTFLELPEQERTVWFGNFGPTKLPLPNTLAAQDGLR